MHTLFNKHFNRASYPQKPNQIARLLTPQIYKNKQCLEFYYHMWGNGQSRLNVLTKSSTGSLSLPLWTRSKNYGNKWILGQLTVEPPIASSPDDLYQIAFEGVIGNSTISYEGDIAIDDIKLEERECPPEGFCDFESSSQRLCTWINSQSNYF